MAIGINVNGKAHDVEAAGDTPLLYVLRNDLELNGAKYGCGFAAIANATGNRLRDLPFTRERVKAALA